MAHWEDDYVSRSENMYDRAPKYGQRFLANHSGYLYEGGRITGAWNLPPSRTLCEGQSSQNKTKMIVTWMVDGLPDRSQSTETFFIDLNSDLSRKLAEESRGLNCCIRRSIRERRRVSSPTRRVAETSRRARWPRRVDVASSRSRSSRRGRAVRAGNASIEPLYRLLDSRRKEKRFTRGCALRCWRLRGAIEASWRGAREEERRRAACTSER